MVSVYLLKAIGGKYGYVAICCSTVADLEWIKNTVFNASISSLAVTIIILGFNDNSSNKLRCGLIFFFEITFGLVIEQAQKHYITAREKHRRQCQ